MLRTRSYPGRRAQAQRLQGGKSRNSGGELPDLKRQLRDLATGVLDGTADLGAATVVNQILNTIIRAVEQERKIRETGELAERLEVMEEVLRGQKTG